MRQQILQVDAFTREPFAGNPAGVCVMSGPANETWMQRVAAEMNLSETAFLYPEDGEYNLRWFTPTVEVGLCGHASLASAHVLWEEGHLPSGEQARFRTQSGRLTADLVNDLIELDFPAEPPQVVVAPREVAEVSECRLCTPAEAA
jgi:PhzF family phenazine biosynthesis protein